MKVSKVSNPLTIIAIFAGLAEASGKAILPFLAPAVQAQYIWFLMLFPTLLVILFFVTLLKDHHVLYSPSDYKDQDDFVELIKEANKEEKEESRRQDKIEVEKKIEQIKHDPTANTLTDKNMKYSKIKKWALNDVLKKYPGTFKKEVILKTKIKNVLFNGVIDLNGQKTFIKFKVFNKFDRNDIINAVQEQIKNYELIAGEHKNVVIVFKIVILDNNFHKSAYNELTSTYNVFTHCGVRTYVEKYNLEGTNSSLA